MMRDVADLTTARPHVHESARFTTNELHAYHQGYYRALCVALQVIEASARNYQRVTAARRAETKRKASA